ncbi:RNA-directed DNA polymerase, eukaryota [Tanacetum coccineum]
MVSSASSAFGNEEALDRLMVNEYARLNKAYNDRKIFPVIMQQMQTSKVNYDSTKFIGTVALKLDSVMAMCNNKIVGPRVRGRERASVVIDEGRATWGKLAGEARRRLLNSRLLRVRLGFTPEEVENKDENKDDDTNDKETKLSTISHMDVKYMWGNSNYNFVHGEALALCLDRHLSDHRPIILREVRVDFGLTPFRFYHSWLDLVGFDDLIQTAWRSFTHDDRNERDPDGFREPANYRCKINFQFPKKLDSSQAEDLERIISSDEIRSAVWNCGDNKSPGPDGYSFEFLKKYWDLVGSDFCGAVEYFFDHGTFPKGCNTSFIALIPKVLDAKLVSDFRPISLIGCVYKVVSKILANRIKTVISDLVSDTQTAFVAGRQILDGPFILDELLQWCKRRSKNALFFKVDFAKAYDSIRWDYLLDVLDAFGFGNRWCKWIRGSLMSATASILVNGSPSNEFVFHCGLKQGDPLAPYLFILIMETLHLSFCRVVDSGSFHGLSINIQKCQLLGVGVSQDIIVQAASAIGWFHMHMTIPVTLAFLLSRKNRLRHGELGFQVMNLPLGVLNIMEGIRNRFFNGNGKSESKITWIAWNKILASKKNGGLGVSSFFALNRALLFKWIWRFISKDGSLWSRVIQAIYGTRIDEHPLNFSSNWCAIVNEVRSLNVKGIDLWSHCRKRIGNGRDTSFWLDCWLDSTPLSVMFPRVFALEEDKDVSVAVKFGILGLLFFSS